MLQDMNDRYSSTLAMLGLVKSLLALDTQKQMVSDNKSCVDSLCSLTYIQIIVIVIFYMNKN
jgi:hypothetical protein